jgi:hypothetical protein
MDGAVERSGKSGQANDLAEGAGQTAPLKPNENFEGAPAPHLLRQYGDDGRILPENLELSGHIDRLISAIIDEASYADLRASGGIVGAP